MQIVQQSIVTKSSAEVDLIALCDVFAMIMACRNFLMRVGVKLESSTVYKDYNAVLEMLKADGP